MERLESSFPLFPSMTVKLAEERRVLIGLWFLTFLVCFVFRIAFIFASVAADFFTRGCELVRFGPKR